jgi:methyl-accepting chemotaxis protein
VLKSHSRSLGARLGLAFAAVLVLCIGSALVAVSQMKTIYAGTVTVTDRWLAGLQETNDIRHYLHSTRRAQLRLTATSPLADVAVRERDIAGHAGHIAELLKGYTAHVGSPEEGALFDAVKARMGVIGEANVALLSFMKASDVRDPQALFDLNEKVAKDMIAGEKALADLIKFNEEGAKQAKADALGAYERALVVTLAAVALALVSGVLLAVLITRSITRPVLTVVRAVESVGNGDLSVRITVDREDELGQLQAGLSKMVGSLATLVGQIRQSVDGIGTSSSEIATGNRDLSERTEQAAANLQQTASSMSQLTGTVRQSAESARTACELAGSAASAATKGGEVVASVVTNMEAITASSRQIGEIIGVIDGIAFQTNILALNAAVEAARAGEQGRGFAVVAAEVRTLAQRSAQAAKEIKQLISRSVEQVESGSVLVREAGVTMDDIVNSVQRVSQVIGEITAASSEQSEGLGQINQAVVQLDRMTQQNAALVEQSSAAAESMKAQADGLRAGVQVFRLG